MQRIRTLIGVALAAVVMLPALPAEAYAPFSTTVRTIASQGDVGRVSAAALMPDGLATVASWDSTNHAIDVIACANAECTVGESHTVFDSGYVADFDMAVGPDGLPVIAASYGPGVVVIKCGDRACAADNTTTSIAFSDWYGTYYGVSIDVGTDNLPSVAYSSSRLSLQRLFVTSCNDVACVGGDEHDKYLAGGTSGYSSDLVVDGGNRAAIAWTKGGETFLTRCADTCGSASTTSIGTGMLEPSIAAAGDRLSIAGRDNWKIIRTVDCAPQCSAPTAVMAWNDRGIKPDIAFVGPTHTVIAFVEPTRGYLEFIDCPSTCLAPQYVDNRANVTGSNVSIAGGDNEAYVSHPRGHADQGLTHIHRPKKPGWGW